MSSLTDISQDEMNNVMDANEIYQPVPNLMYSTAGPPRQAAMKNRQKQDEAQNAANRALIGGKYKKSMKRRVKKGGQIPPAGKKLEVPSFAPASSVAVSPINDNHLSQTTNQILLDAQVQASMDCDLTNTCSQDGGKKSQNRYYKKSHKKSYKKSHKKLHKKNNKKVGGKLKTRKSRR